MQKTPEVENNMGRIFFITGHTNPARVKLRIEIDGEVVGYLPSLMHFFYRDLPLGHHTITNSRIIGGCNVIDLNIESRKHYYIEATTGSFSAKFFYLDDEEGKRRIQLTRFSEG